MADLRVDYPIIPSLEKFDQLLHRHGTELIKKLEPDYYKRFKTGLTLGLNAKQIHESCDSLLTGSLKKYVDLLESLYEVRYYWKRFREAIQLLEITKAPDTINKINDAQFFVYNLDAYWHAQYSLEERLLTFLKRLRGYYKKTEYNRVLEAIDSYINVVIKSKTGTKLARDPVAHQRSQGVIGWSERHDWEASLARQEYLDLISIYDNRMLHDKEFYLGYIRKWAEQREQGMSYMFEQLLNIPLDPLI